MSCLVFGEGIQETMMIHALFIRIPIVFLD